MQYKYKEKNGDKKMSHNGKCSVCGKYFKKGEKWLFIYIGYPGQNLGKPKVHYDCENPKKKY